MEAKGSQLLNRLRKAVQKAKFLLSFSATRWIFSSLQGLSPGSRRLSFDRRPSLLDCVDDDDDIEVRSSSFGSPRSWSPASAVVSRTTSRLSRTTSDASSSDDVDRRADEFIANFYKHVQMERQVSLELRYLERTPSPSP